MYPDLHPAVLSARAGAEILRDGKAGFYHVYPDPSDVDELHPTDPGMADDPVQQRDPEFSADEAGAGCSAAGQYGDGHYDRGGV